MMSSRGAGRPRSKWQPPPTTTTTVTTSIGIQSTDPIASSHNTNGNGTIGVKKEVHTTGEKSVQSFITSSDTNGGSGMNNILHHAFVGTGTPAFLSAHEAVAAAESTSHQPQKHHRAPSPTVATQPPTTMSPVLASIFHGQNHFKEPMLNAIVRQNTPPGQGTNSTGQTPTDTILPVRHTHARTPSRSRNDWNGKTSLLADVSENAPLVSDTDGIELSTITFHTSPRSNQPSHVSLTLPSTPTGSVGQVMPLSPASATMVTGTGIRPPMSPSSPKVRSILPPISPSSPVAFDPYGPLGLGLAYSTPTLANGKPNKALISARQAFLAKTSRGANSPSSGSGGATLIPGINDSPPKKTRTLSTIGTSASTTLNRASSMGPASPSAGGTGKKLAPAASTPSAHGTTAGSKNGSATVSPTQGKRSLSVVERGFTNVFGSSHSSPGVSSTSGISVGAVGSNGATTSAHWDTQPLPSPSSRVGGSGIFAGSPSSRVTPQQQKRTLLQGKDFDDTVGTDEAKSSIGGSPSARIRIIPTAEEIGREGLGVDGTDIEPKDLDPNDPPFKPVLKFKPAARSKEDAERKAQIALQRTRRNKWKWNWNEIRMSLAKSRPVRPVIGGKLAFRPTLRYIPIARELWSFSQFVHGAPYQLFMFLLIIVSIFATSFTLAFLPANVDPGTDLLLFITLLIWCLDLLVNWMLHSNYMACIYFYFDFLSILSLVVDITSCSLTSGGFSTGWSMGVNENSYYTLSTGNGKMTFLAQLSMVLKTLRILKLVRAVNLLLRKYVKKSFEHMESLRCLGKNNNYGSGVNGGGSMETHEGINFDPTIGITGTGSSGWNHHNPFDSRSTPTVVGGSFSTTVLTPPPSQLGTIMQDTISIRTALLVVTLGCLVPILVMNPFNGITKNESSAKTHALNHLVDSYVLAARAGGDLPAAPISSSSDTLHSSASADSGMSDSLTSTTWIFNEQQAVAMPLLYSAFLATHLDSSSSRGVTGLPKSNLIQFATHLQVLPILDSTAQMKSPESSVNDVSESGSDSSQPLSTLSDSSTSTIYRSDPLWNGSDRRCGLEWRIFESKSAEFVWSQIQPSSSSVPTLPIRAVYTVQAIFDMSSDSYQTAWLHILFQLVLILGYIVGTLTLNEVLADLIIHPFERIVAVVWKLTRSLGIVKDEKYRSKNYGSASGGSGSGPVGDAPPQTGPARAAAEQVPLSTRIYRDVKSTFLPCRIRAYEIRIIDDMISKLCRIFHVTPASKNAILTALQSGGGSALANVGSFGSPAQSSPKSEHRSLLSATAGVAQANSSHLSKSMRLLTGTRTTEIQTPHTILTVQVSERPLDKELKGVKGTVASPGQRVRVKNYGDHSKRRNSLSSHAEQAAGGAGSSDYESSTASAVGGPNKKPSRSEISHSGSALSERAIGSDRNGSTAHSPDRVAAHAAVLSNVQSSIVLGGHALGLTTSPQPSPPNSPPQSSRPSSRASNKAGFLLGFVNTNKPTGKHEILIKAGHVDERDHPELASLEMLLVQPLALTHFRSFLKSKRSLEIFLFYIQVLKFQQDLVARANWIYSHFIRIGSSQECNLPSEIRSDISVQMSAPSFYLFERAKGEVINMLRGSFQEFVASESALNYLTQKLKERIVLTPPATIQTVCQQEEEKQK